MVHRHRGTNRQRQIQTQSKNKGPHFPHHLRCTGTVPYDPVDFLISRANTPLHRHDATIAHQFAGFCVVSALALSTWIFQGGLGGGLGDSTGTSITLGRFAVSTSEWGEADDLPDAPCISCFSSLQRAFSCPQRFSSLLGRLLGSSSTSL